MSLFSKKINEYLSVLYTANYIPGSNVFFSSYNYSVNWPPDEMDTWQQHNAYKCFSCDLYMWEQIVIDAIVFVYIALLPQIYLHPLNKTVRVANDSVKVNFTCMADEVLSYYWLKENGNISSTAEGVNTNKLLLRSILPSDSGRYQCVAVNENGKSYSNYGTLTVEGNNCS